jgi:hypothetical protein
MHGVVEGQKVRITSGRTETVFYAECPQCEAFRAWGAELSSDMFSWRVWGSQAAMLAGYFAAYYLVMWLR